ncbi:CBS domain-containing protein [Lyngbya confervoides]|uniref:CBS domain-containing protein n=1 Tax=Lyngbya confervoides BDU141951 TaxID=1574623 RepID=A0ABD4T0Y2_9CYAN|nr:CBS domain-containing protein [Lyngbya confervoides]MCM1982189.1 CBS domain-containing protein [Lyngbya confervoides BDU141951]
MHSLSELVLCHRTADFDALGAAVGLARLRPGTRIVLCGGAHPAVRNFLALYRDEFPLIERRSVTVEAIRRITVVDTQRREQLGPAQGWLDLPQVQVEVWDHHVSNDADIKTDNLRVEAVGATTTLMVEQCQQQHLPLSVADLTVMALGIHVDTGSLTYEGATVRDARALAWLMAQGANQRAIADYIEPGFSTELQDLLAEVLQKLQTVVVRGYRLGWVLVQTSYYVPGLSSLASQLTTLSESDAILLGHIYRTHGEGPPRLTVIARARADGIDVAQVLQPLGGGGHAHAAAVTLKTEDPRAALDQMVTSLRQSLPIPPTARDLMSSPVRTLRPEATINQARRILLRYGHSGLSVVNPSGDLVGIISRRDLDIALHHGFGHAPVKGYMKSPVKTIHPDTALPEIEALMVNYDIGRLPVVDGGQILGIVTRTDILRQIHQLKRPQAGQASITKTSIRSLLESTLPPPLKGLLKIAAQQAEARGWQLYLVGGAVRDLLLAQSQVHFREFDLVVDSGGTSDLQGAGGELARSIAEDFPEAQLQIYGEFQTAALIWHDESHLGPFSMDIATARSEFYPYPAANPEISVSSIRQDLYRRDFSINALAVRLTGHQNSPQQRGELLDFFGGVEDLEQKLIRVLHPNSFIEDPTRIFRAIRFASRLGFSLDEQTKIYLQTAIASGIYQQTEGNHHKAPALQSRLRNELKYIVQEVHWLRALALIQDLGAWCCIHPDLAMPPSSLRAIKMAARWLEALNPEPGDRRWPIILEVLLLQLPESARLKVAQKLQLPEGSQMRLGQFQALVQRCSDQLQGHPSPSRVVKTLRPYSPELIILGAVCVSVSVRAILWRYLQIWQHVQPMINGATLIEMGYRPGKKFRAMLDFILDATLDGQVSDPASAQQMVRQRFD